MSILKRVAYFLAVFFSAVAGGFLVFITLGSWGKSSTPKTVEKVVGGNASVEVKNENSEADKAHADSINSALDKLP